MVVCDKSQIWWQFVPNQVLVLGTSKEPDVEDLRVARPCSDDIGTRTSVMYSGLQPLTDE